jgi:uncharacterized membrane protein
MAFAKQRAPLILSWVILFALSAVVVFPYQSIALPLVNFYQEVLRNPAASDAALATLSAAISGAAIGGVLLGWVLALGLSVVEVGYTKICLNATDGKMVQIADMFSTLRQFGRWLIAALLILVKVMLWSLLFFIPGIIAALNYSQTYFIMLDDPDIGAMEAINQSITLMRGHKAEYFVLMLSFILWEMLVSVTLGIAALYVGPYYQLTLAEYYRELSGTRGLGLPVEETVVVP